MMKDQINTTGGVRVKDRFPNILQVFCGINQPSFGEKETISVFKLVA